MTFYSKAAFRRHRKDPTSQCSPPAVTEFRCCDCDKEFLSSRSLRRHLAAEHPNFREPPPPRTRGIHYCEQCDKSFETKGGLQSHRANSRVHNPLLDKKVDCVRGCKRKFDAPSGWLAHLESGVCKSGITRDKIDNAIIAQDRTNIITDPDAVLTRQAGNLSLASREASTICDGSRFDTPDDSSDAESIHAQSEAFDGHLRYHTAGGVSLTPGASIQPAGEPTIDQLHSWLLPDGTFECPICPPNTATFRRPSVATLAELQTHMQSLTVHPQLNHNPHALFPDPYDPPISTASSESGIATPSTIPAQSYLLPNGKYKCPLCPSESRRLFKSLAALRKHMLSPIPHIPKIYHCPDPELLGIVPSEGPRRKRQKNFATISALAQHVESGACQGGRSMFQAMVGFVNEKLVDVGMGDMKMIATE